jgi:homoserine dehydrogenase
MQFSEEIGVGLIGFGTIGTGVVRYFQEGRGEPFGVRLKKVADSDLSRPREVEFPGLTERASDVINDPEIQIVVELVGGENPALDFILDSMNLGKSVVTANKAVISRHIKVLFDAARDRDVDLAFEASVGGGIPIIRVLNGYKGDRFSRITGILNGTSNYILSRMEEGMDFEAALEIAQEKGFAEAAHELDTGGFDARDKLAIISSLAFGCAVVPEQIYCEGITGVTPVDLDFAEKHGVDEGGIGYSIRHLATARMVANQLELHVYPALISKDHPLSSVRNEVNAVYWEGELCGPQLFQGKGAGRDATTSAVLSDIFRLAHNLRSGTVDELPLLDRQVQLADVGSLQRRGYVRMGLKHIPGSIAETARIMGEHGFNIEDSVQRRKFRTESEGKAVIPDIVTVEALPYSTVEKAFRDLKESERVCGDPFFLRFES